MKYLVVICNGLSDEPIVEKDNRTPLNLAETPNMDRMAAEGRCGSVRTVPQNMPVGGEASYLSLFGYSPETCRAGAAEWEARALDVEIEDDQIPLCCDFVTLQSSHNDMIMKDYTAGQLGAEEARLLLDALQDQIVDEEVRFHYGTGYHNLMLIRQAPFSNRLSPPNELVGEGIRQHMPDGEEHKNLVFLMNQAQIILHNHALNKKRKQEGSDTVNSIWLWGNGQGIPKSLPSFFSRFEKKAAVVTASLLMRGIAKSIEMDWNAVEGATGFSNTNYAGKVKTALAALKDHDVVFVHVSGLEPVSLQGLIDDKVLAIEDIDQQLLGPLIQACEGNSDLRLLLVESHMSSANLMRYKNDPVPFVAYPSAKGADSIERFDEDILSSGTEHFQSGPALMEEFFKGNL